MKSASYAAIVFCAVVTASIAAPWDLVMTLDSDFSGGIFGNVELIPDPAYPEAALILNEFDTINVLQIIPDDEHCLDCIYKTVDSLAVFGEPALSFNIEVTTLDIWNDISGLTDNFLAEDPSDPGGGAFSTTLMEYDIIFFGVGNGFGGRNNDLDNSGRQRVRDFAALGKGIILTHDSIAKRRGREFTTPLCTDINDYEHEYFNSITDVTGLGAEWVDCYAPDDLYHSVIRDPGAPDSPILHAPFELPASFPITACHEFGEIYDDGQIWYISPDGRVFMHTYHSGTYGSYAAYFSTGHYAEEGVFDWRPAATEGMAMINSMYYAYYGGRGSGMFESVAFTAECPGELLSFEIDVDTAGESSATIELASSVDGIVWSDFYIVAPGASVPAFLAAGPYYRYRVIMERGIHAERPVLHSITWHFELPNPDLELLMPPLGSFYSCTCGSVTWQVHSESGIDVLSAEIEANSVSYPASRCDWNSVDSIFSFLGPSECWEHGVTYDGSIVDLTGATGCSYFGDSAFAFTADFEPPTITDIQPPPDTIISDTHPILRVTVHDSTSDEQNSTFYWRVNGDLISYGMAGLSWNGTIGELSLSTFMAGIDLVDTVEICIGAGDIAIGCGPNMAESCYTIIVDTAGPVVELISPDVEYYSCDSLDAIFLLTDLVGVDTTSLTVSAAGDDWLFPTGMAISSDTLFLKPGLALSDGDTIDITFTTLVDMLGNERTDESFRLLIDQSPPELSGAIPPNGGFVGITNPNVSFSLIDYLSGLAEDSVTIEVDGITYVLADGSWDGEELILDGATLGWAFEHNDSIVVCVHAVDNAGGCGPNVLDTCWFFNVNLRGPECVPIAPLDGWNVGCDSFHVRFYLTDPNGVDHSTIAFSINSIPYDITSPEVTLIGDTIEFYPGTPWSDGEIVNVQITSAEDSLGNELEDPCDWTFTVDLTAPIITPLTPPHNGVVDTTQPRIAALIEDVSGVSDSGLTICVNGECWGYDSLPPGLIWSGDSLIFEPWIAGQFFESETVFVTIYACDETQLCGPNCGDTSWFFLIDNLGPRAFLVEPDSGSWSSCSLQVFKVRVLDPSGLIMDSLEILVNGAPIRWPDSHLEYIGDTLIFTPTVTWNHLDVVDFELQTAYDSIGNPLQDTIFTRIYIDLTPPDIGIISPLPGANDVLPLDSVIAIISDDGCGLNIDELEFYADGYFVPLGSGIAWRGDSLVYDPVEAGLHFSEGETVSVRIIAEDCAGYCPPNRLDTTWNFYIPDDDTIPPVWIDYTPNSQLADSLFYLTCRAFDSSGIYTASPPDSQSPFIIWDTDGELSATCDTAFLDFVSESADTMAFRTATTLYSPDADDDIYFIASCWDNDFDFGVPADRTRGDSPLWFIEIVARAGVEMVLPHPGWVTTCRDQGIRFVASGEVALDMASCVFVIDDDTLSIADVELIADGDSAFIYTPAGDVFDNGAIYVSLIEATDELGNPLFVPIEWIFYVDTEPPGFTLIEPNDGQMVPEDNYGFRVGIADLMCGVDEQLISVDFLINSSVAVRYTTDSSGISWDSLSGVLAFNPTSNMPIDDGDSLQITICAGDAPDLCPPNIDCFDFAYWIEPHVDCSTSTNPFTPNLDSYNDEIAFLWPHFFRDDGTVKIYDMRGVPVRVYDVPAGNLKAAEWDGMDDNQRKCPGGVYIYVVEVNGKHICTGSITLIR